MKSRSAFSLILSTIFFTALQPGIVAGYFPWLVSKDSFLQKFAQPFGLQQHLGIVIGAVGFVIMMGCIVRFAVEGMGTLSPADPTKRLVIRGLYKYSRNPMYVGVMGLLIGESVFTQSSPLWIYSIVIFSAFNIYIIFFEEPRLRRDFGKEYGEYCERVRRWM
jgi:protein-S-isoprenylcysteine O-methyltransferase Ste14